jgi:cellulose synthase (UDP-forming)
MDHKIEFSPKTSFLQTNVSKPLLLLNMAMALVYFFALLFYFPKGNPLLFWSLIVGEVFHVWMVVAFCYTVWETEYQAKFDTGFKPPVDVCITVAGEPVEIVEQTTRAALAMDYPNFTVNILNDGYIARKDNWKEIEAMAKQIGVNCITRKIPGGAKSGNINNGLRETSNPYVAIFDADHVPHENFLEKTMGFFADQRMGFVQSPQYYKNFSENYVTGGAWEQQELFFGPICRGKNRLNATFMCGTNMVLSRRALLEAGGMCETNIAEDFVTSLFIHEKGYNSVYVPEVLSEGLAPEDFLSYYKQQFRWARGSLEVIFKYNPLFRRGLTWAQRIQYLTSASFYLSGAITLMNALLPIVFFFTGWVPFVTSTMAVALVFLPYIFLTVYVLQLTSNYSYTYRALCFAMSSFTIHLQALWAVLTSQKSGFSVTSKKGLRGNFWYLSFPHMLYILTAVVGIGIAVRREGLDASVMTNISWAFFNVGIFIPFILASVSLIQNEKEEYSISSLATAPVLNNMDDVNTAISIPTPRKEKKKIVAEVVDGVKK